jgi:hypothetical protein
LLRALGVFEDLFWFLPGRRGLCAQIRAALELRADAAALDAGADPTALASALVRTGELSLHPAPAVATLGAPSLLSQRVQRLIAARTATRAVTQWPDSRGVRREVAQCRTNIPCAEELSAKSFVCGLPLEIG